MLIVAFVPVFILFVSTNIYKRLVGHLVDIPDDVRSGRREKLGLYAIHERLKNGKSVCAVTAKVQSKYWRETSKGSAQAQAVQIF